MILYRILNAEIRKSILDYQAAVRERNHTNEIKAVDRKMDLERIKRKLGL